MPHLSPATSPEPLVRSVDLAQYTEGLARYRAGGWDDEQWTAFRVRFGIYGQKQPGVQMVRIKIPGGVVPVAWLRTIAEANRRFAEGKAHVTTRQDVQIYYVATDRTADLMAFLNENGVTTREACGNTIRNLTSCALSGVCPREHVDAGKVASDLARLWLRHPLTQHMPRKFKIAVSGCETDCGATGLHDMGLVATERDGLKGFRVVAAGGLGGTPRPAVVVADFATAAEIPAILEALLRLHQRYSDRRNRNASRIKFLVNRFGEDKFLTLFAEELERVKGLPGRPFAEPSWRAPSAAPEPGTPGGVVAQHDGLSAIVIDLPLGCISSDEMDALAGIAERAGVAELRATREQSLVVAGVQPAEAARVVAEIRALGLKVADAEGGLPDVISCPGTTTCRIGITSSYNFAAEVLAQAETDPRAKLVNVRVSGCQNSCGLH
ncbi:MAG: nitrite/sulfite reductase, partial [Rhodospirillales bacterium]|nr:nitrite/sulfite reductase [Rhodospirillales bacterium]